MDAEHDAQCGLARHTGGGPVTDLLSSITGSGGSAGGASLVTDPGATPTFSDMGSGGAGADAGLGGLSFGGGLADAGAAATGAGADPGIGGTSTNPFAGLGNVLGGLFGSPTSAPGTDIGATATTPLTPAATPAAPDLGSAVTPGAVSGAAAAANPVPNASGTPDLMGGPAITPPPTDATATTPSATAAAPGVTSVGQLSEPSITGGAPSSLMTKLFGTGGGAGSPSLLGKGGILPQLVGGGAIIKDLASAGQLPKGSNQLLSEAGTQAGLAKSYAAQAEGEGQGILPAGAQALVQQNLDANVAAIKTKYAGLGMSGSSAETQDINAARNQALAQTFAIGQSLAQSGLQEVTSSSGLEANILNQIMNAETAQNTQLGDALASFAGASVDGGRTPVAQAA